jgi:DNA polymerase III epsilon subunit-like protein/DNA-binding Xre family transcriptional regulator
MNFIAIDFETANSSRSSACSVGIVEVENGQIVLEQSWLINPNQRFDGRNIGIHGITPSMVEGKPTFQQLWPQLLPYLQNKKVVAHNASFDMSVLRYCMDEYSLQYPTFNYFCTYLIGKRQIPDMPSYKLNLIAEHFGIHLKHHDAQSDARAAALILLKFMEQGQFTDIIHMSETQGYEIGKIYPGGYSPFSAPASKVHRSSAIEIPESPIIPIVEMKTIKNSGLKLISGQKTDITKNLDTTKLLVEVNWDLLNPEIEIDTSAFLLYEDGKCQRDDDCIFYGNPDTRNGSISYSKINSNKSQFKIAYDKLPNQIQKISFTLTIYEGEEQEHYFSHVAEITIRIIDPLTGNELMKFSFGEGLSNETAIVIAEIYLYKGEWKFNPIGKGFFGGLRALCGEFGIDVSDETNEAASTSESIPPKAVYDYDEAFYIGHNVERIRRSLSFTQKQLALQIGYKSANPISRLERGEVERLTHDQLIKFAEALKCNIRQLLTK